MGAPEEHIWVDEQVHAERFPACPGAHTPHHHLPDSVRNWTPDNKLVIDPVVLDLAKVILEEHRSEDTAEKTRLEQVWKSETEITDMNSEFLELVKGIGALSAS